MLCSTCYSSIEQAFRTLRLNYIETSHLKTKIGSESFRRSVLSGCRICSHLCLRVVTENGQLEDEPTVELTKFWDEEIAKWNPERPSPAGVADDRTGNTISPATLWLEMHSRVAQDGFVSLEATLSIYQKRFAGTFTIMPSPEVIPDPEASTKLSQCSSTGDPSTWYTAAAWVNDCLANHEACSSDRHTKDFYPRRLLAVGSDGSATVKVIDTVEAPVRGAYTSLSHCWGSAPPYKLVKASLDVLFSGVPTTELPQTFRDAVVVTRRLGVDYIWIDSLCILQDDLDDWRREAASMADIYSSSFCNLAALASVDSNGGLFRDRRSVHAHPTTVDITNTQLFSGQYLINCISPTDKTDPTPLLSRAWVLQERFFSRRTLYFGKTQLFFECGQSSMSETWPLERCKLSNLSSLWTPIQDLIAQEVPRPHRWTLENPDYASRWGAFAWWKNLVQIYTKCHLTFQSDKLVAISAIAKKIRELLKTQYLAGLWRSTLSIDLCWAAVTPSRRDQMYRAPSWSWAAVDCALVEDSRWSHAQMLSKAEFSEFSSPVMLEVVDTEITPAGHDDTGQVLDAWICVQGRPVPTTISRIKYILENRDHAKHTHTATSECSILYDLDIQWDYIGDSAQMEKVVYFLPIVQHGITEGIIIERAVDKGDGFFRRLAHFVLFKADRKLWSKFCMAVSEKSFDVFGPPGPAALESGHADPFTPYGVMKMPKQAMILV